MKAFLRFFLSASLYYSGLFYLAKLRNYWSGNRLTILALHRVSGVIDGVRFGGLPSITISKENFERLLCFVKKHYTVISLAKYVQLARREEALKGNYLILTFDDGYLEMREHVLPLLKKYDVPAILFVPTAIINDGGFFWWDAAYELLTNKNGHARLRQRLAQSDNEDWAEWLKKILFGKPDQRDQLIYDFIEFLQKSSPEKRQHFIDLVEAVAGDFWDRQSTRVATVLDWSGIKDLHDGGIEIGSHTKNHCFLSTIPDEEVRLELLQSKKELEQRLGIEINTFSYPGGKYSEETVKSVSASGYACAVTTESGLNRREDHLLKLKRINIWDETVSNAAGQFSNAVAAWSLFVRC